jgi:hypothetical protein
MTLYTVDGAVGKITSAKGGVDPAHDFDEVGNVNVVDGQNSISLTSPSVLLFNKISWLFRVSQSFEDRALLFSNLEEQQLDGTIDGETGYTRAGSWYTKAQGANEGFEVHAAVGEAWWQLLFTGLGKALFTNGQWSQEVTIEALAWYTVTMVIDAATGDTTITLFDYLGNEMASGSATGLSISLSESSLGATGTVLNRIEALRDVTYLEIGEPSSTQGDIDSFGEARYFSGGGTGFTSAITVDSKTGGVGTTSGDSAIPWTVPAPAETDCAGLDYTFLNWRTVGTWYRYTVGEIPEGFEDAAVRMFPKLKGTPGGFGNGKHVEYRQASDWPTSWVSGAITLLSDVANAVSPVPMYVTIPGEGENFYLGIQPLEWADPPPWYLCGNGFSWPDDTGTGESWRVYYDPPSKGGMAWVILDDAGELFFDIDEIRIGVAADVGEPIVEENEVAEGWNTEMVVVDAGAFFISATPVAGTVNVYSADGQLLDYVTEWVEADDLGMNYLIVDGGYTSVTVVYFVTRPMLGNDPMLSRPTQREVDETQRTTMKTPIPT